MIIGYLSFAVAAFVLAFTIKLGRKTLHHLAIKSVALLNAMLIQTDEDAHIKNVEHATKKLFSALLTTIALFALAIVLASIPMVFLYAASIEIYEEVSIQSLYGILSVSIGATLPFIIPTKKSKTTSYSELQQLLHHLVLDNVEIGKKLFQFERKRYSTLPDHDAEQFVIVSGLARAGTTSLIIKLATLEIFATLSYANMPLLMAPNLWSKIYQPKNNKTKERSHKDGIEIGLNSNEALEEYFFKIITNNRFVHENKLMIHELSEEEYHDYLDYQNVVRKHSSHTYLAKNNNFLLRYDAIRKINSSFVMIIMFRDPLTHASSLLDKHLSFSKLQTEDPFVLDYMNWLGHHEFGLNHIRFDFGNSDELSSCSKNSIEYWLHIWINYYEYALSAKHKNTIYICYEEYCQNPRKAIGTVFEKLDISAPFYTAEPFKNRRNNVSDFDPKLLEKAQKLYAELRTVA
ncbi:MAG: sulfotransferase family protein [Salibacteraceae bacterium]|nr:sulfotransferase family protein [Salibacteraceae bacterium]